VFRERSSRRPLRNISSRVVAPELQLSILLSQRGCPADVTQKLMSNDLHLNGIPMERDDKHHLTERSFGGVSCHSTAKPTAETCTK